MVSCENTADFVVEARVAIIIAGAAMLIRCRNADTKVFRLRFHGWYCVG
jgi:hypothetical protein